MTHREDHHEKVPALGEPAKSRDATPEPDFADEHNSTAVDREIITGADEDEREPESPHGWSGMER